MEVDKQLKFKSHKSMQVEFISNNVDVITQDCLSSVALALKAHVSKPCRSPAPATTCDILYSTSNSHQVIQISGLIVTRFFLASDLRVQMENWCRRRSRVYFKHRNPVTVSRKAEVVPRERKSAISETQGSVRISRKPNIVVACVNTPRTVFQATTRPQVWIILHGAWYQFTSKNCNS